MYKRYVTSLHKRGELGSNADGTRKRYDTTLLGIKIR